MVTSCCNIRNSLVSKHINYAWLTDRLGLLADSQLTKSRLTACQHQFALRVQEDSVFVARSNAVDYHIPLKVDFLWCTVVVLREAELPLAVFTPSVNALRLLLGVKHDADCMLAAAGHVKHRQVAECVDKCRLRTRLDRNRSPCIIKLTFRINHTDA